MLTCTCCSFCCSSALSASAASALWLNRASSTSSCCRRALSALAALHNTCVQRVVQRDKTLPAGFDAGSAVLLATCAGHAQQPTCDHAVVPQLRYTCHTCPNYPKRYGEVLRDVSFSKTSLWRPALLPACAGAHRVSTNADASSERVRAGPKHHVHSPKYVHVCGWMAFGAACLVVASSTAAVWPSPITGVLSYTKLM